MAISQHTTATLPVEVFLRGCVGYSVSDEALMSILLNREVEFGSLVSSLSTKQRELCMADLYMYCATLPSVSGTVEDSDAGWKHREGGTQKSASDRASLIDKANLIYRKYGETTNKSTIKLRPFGMRLW
jgi:hypothetical protein